MGYRWRGFLILRGRKVQTELRYPLRPKVKMWRGDEPGFHVRRWPSYIAMLKELPYPNSYCKGLPRMLKFKSSLQIQMRDLGAISCAA